MIMEAAFVSMITKVKRPWPAWAGRHRTRSHDPHCPKIAVDTCITPPGSVRAPSQAEQKHKTGVVPPANSVASFSLVTDARGLRCWLSKCARSLTKRAASRQGHVATIVWTQDRRGKCLGDVAHKRVSQYAEYTKLSLRCKHVVTIHLDDDPSLGMDATHSELGLLLCDKPHEPCARNITGASYMCGELQHAPPQTLSERSSPRPMLCSKFQCADALVRTHYSTHGLNMSTCSIRFRRCSHFT